ncbi:hypothetical protein A2210_02830 [Candidatus Woesebacteria bacterium RIFOXYA1_FULL_40_18]|uniref:DOD-type homing endonuclease domain-containing protein n=1 Tax=Candidatus Woesebacteria bacterium RIFOXYA1_FULL_40_18 TaxID=1802532 RepID=A0A1F8CN81_9BACT|nr:MAG: hypothetical protein A2210_02830 [Candidatus Woesebacteria bacterium RIFOXYA1_FULL_40_18]
METHLKFRDGEQKLFIEKVIQKSDLNINRLASIVAISPRSFRDWRREKLSISKSAALLLRERFNIEFPEKIEALQDRWAFEKSENGKIGGLAYKSKYGNPATTEGRRKGGSKTLTILRNRGIIPQINMFNRPRRSVKLAEFVGIMLGDGGIGKLQISITLNSIKDLEYSAYVVQLCESLFGKKPKVRKRKNANALEIYLNGVNLIRFLKEIGLVQGNKVKNQVDVPGWIKSNVKYRARCLRGLMDTDGGVFVHKYKSNGKIYRYKKVNFTNRSIPLLKFVYNTLKELNFHPKLLDKIENRRVWLYNSQEVPQYLNVVGSSNYRLNRYKVGGVA